jgi:hypothetical protein
VPRHAVGGNILLASRYGERTSRGLDEAKTLGAVAVLNSSSLIRRRGTPLTLPSLKITGAAMRFTEQSPVLLLLLLRQLFSARTAVSLTAPDAGGRDSSES